MHNNASEIIDRHNFSASKAVAMLQCRRLIFPVREFSAAFENSGDTRNLSWLGCSTQEPTRSSRHRQPVVLMDLLLQFLESVRSRERWYG